MLADDDGRDLHLPHYIELFGGVDLPRAAAPLRGPAAQGARLHGRRPDDRRAGDDRAGRRRRAGGAHDRPRGHNRLPVVEHGRLVGVVTRVDVLEALTREAEPVPLRAVARVDVGAIERNAARLRAGLAGGRRAVRVVKADGYGHGAVAGRPRRPGGRGATWLAVATAEEARALRAAGIDGPLLVLGALSETSCRWRSRRAPTSSPGARASSHGLAARRRARARACQARHRHGPAGHARPRGGHARRRGASPRRRRSSWRA